MENLDKKSKKVNKTFLSEYKKIVNPLNNSVIIDTEWTRKGDYFQKLSMYDDSYRPVQTLGSTTLIKAI